ncbi:MAG TPA: heat-inducible transcriptional repressor HrcA [Acidimicrobiales bacterium]|nr:heat-inducible transcriptional repressor HrcA [Acidimicrobiales bacterium]
MLDERKAAILRAVVEEYIDTAQPVGSAHVAQASGVQVSSATVRNDMAALEAEGYLRQPHTSAGRIPTEKGYRFFVDHLAPPARLRGDDAVQVRAFFDQAHGELERMLHDTSRLLGDLTHYAGVVVGPKPTEATIRSVQLVGLTRASALVVVVLSNGVVEKHHLDLSEAGPTLAEGAGEERIAAASARLAAHLAGTARSALPPLGSSGDDVVDALCDLALRSLADERGTEPDQVYVGGTSRIAQAFDAIETVREVLGILEQQLVVVSLLRDVLDRGLQVAIGTETGMANLADCALIVSPYEVDGEPAGSIGVLGPARMDYPQAMAAVAVVGNRLSQRLTEG